MQEISIHEKEKQVILLALVESIIRSGHIIYDIMARMHNIMCERIIMCLDYPLTLHATCQLLMKNKK